MKTTRLFAVAIALLSVLSCQKEEQQVINNSKNEGGVLITCTFANNDAATRTTVGTDGLTPMWAAGDEIMLYDGSSNTQKLTLALSGTASSTEGIIDGTDATKFTFAKPSGWTNVYAIYPYSACVSNFSASAPKLNFSGQDGTFGKANICAAAESSGTMSFNNVGAILKFPSKSATVTNILIPVAGLAKDYTVSFSGAAPTLTPADATNSGCYSIGSGTGEIYIGVPAQILAAGHSFFYQDSNKDILGSYTTEAANNIETNKVYILSAIAANGTIPAGMLSKAFSVSATKKVYFSNGNLRATYSTSTSSYSWGFTANQWDYIGKAAGNTTINSQTDGAVVDLFGWVGESSTKLTGAFTKYGISTSMTATDYGNLTSDALKADWAAISTLPQIAGRKWHTLSKDEWTYLLNTRSVKDGTGEGKSYRRATINSDETGVYGMIIYPDNYTSQMSATSYTSSEWSAMESAGCVFLPAAGSRRGSTLYYVGSWGRYWSSSPNGSNAGYASNLSFDSNSVNPASGNTRYYGFSVRLVCAAQ